MLLATVVNLVLGQRALKPNAITEQKLRSGAEGKFAKIPRCFFDEIRPSCPALTG
jgi:hypothetical protein